MHVRDLSRLDYSFTLQKLCHCNRIGIHLDYLSYILSRIKGGSRFDLKHNTGVGV